MFVFVDFSEELLEESDSGLQVYSVPTRVRTRREVSKHPTTKITDNLLSAVRPSPRWNQSSADELKIDSFEADRAPASLYPLFNL